MREFPGAHKPDYLECDRSCHDQNTCQREIPVGLPGKKRPMKCLWSRTSICSAQSFCPFRSPQSASRPRVVDLPDRRMDTNLILVSAPAGYGQPTLVSGWLRDSRISSAWLHLDTGDNDPVRFLQYQLTAFQHIAPGMRNECAISPPICSRTSDRAQSASRHRSGRLGYRRSGNGPGP